MTGDCDSRQWGANELTEACSQAYGDLYHNIHGMRDDFVAFWRESARRFANLSVLGYEIINEPFAGEQGADGKDQYGRTRFCKCQREWSAQISIAAAMMFAVLADLLLLQVTFMRIHHCCCRVRPVLKI